MIIIYPASVHITQSGTSSAARATTEKLFSDQVTNSKTIIKKQKPEVIEAEYIWSYNCYHIKHYL